MNSSRAELSSSEALLARLIKLTPRKEDFITECFAAVLQADKHAANTYWRILTAGTGTSIRAARVEKIETQCRFGNGSACCDLVLQAGREHVAIEHKIDAPQGRDQLVRYLSLPRTEVTRVALVASDYQKVSDAAVINRRYIKPTSGHSHFLWADFYPLLKQSESRGCEVAAATRGLFDRLGFQPAHPLIGDLRTRDPDLRVRLDARLYAAWQPLLKTLQKEWEFADSCIRKDRKSEIYIWGGKTDELGEVWLDPFSNPGSLRIRLKSDARTKRDLIVERLEEGRRLIPRGRYLRWQANPQTPYKQHFRWHVDARIPWRYLLAGADRRTMPPVIKKHVLALIAVAQGAG